MQMIIRKDDDLLAVAARVIFLSLIAAVSFASLAPGDWVPHLLYSYHLEHFAAFYLMTLSMAAARHHTSPNRLLLDVAALASILEIMRLLAPPHDVSAAQDWVADIGGALAALSPMFIADFRRSFREGPPPPMVVEGDDG